MVLNQNPKKRSRQSRASSRLSQPLISTPLGISAPTVERSYAWATLRNKATISIVGLPPTMEWIESAVLKKQGGKWKIAFYHSSIAKPAK